MLEPWACGHSAISNNAKRQFQNTFSFFKTVLELSCRWVVFVASFLFVVSILVSVVLFCFCLKINSLTKFVVDARGGLFYLVDVFDVARLFVDFKYSSSLNTITSGLSLAL